MNQRQRINLSSCGGSVLSVGKLAPGQGNYYLRSVAQGAEDYYLFSGEAPGRWLGGGCGGLALEGRVEPEQFTSLLSGCSPKDGTPLGKQWATSRLPGFDLTFSAPKSVSILWALGGEDLSQQLRDAHDRAVDAATGYLERTASHGRRGHAGSEQIESSGFLAAAFRHRTSRAGDPHLHTHVVVANRVRGADGRWSSLDGRAIYRQAKTAGTLYQAHLRHELQELGLSWTVAPTGVAEIDGVPRDVRREFSQRRREIERSLVERGASSARAAQVATLQTRKAKDYGVKVETLQEQWEQRAAVLGFRRSTVDDLLEAGRNCRRRKPAGSQDFIELRDQLLSPIGLTERASSFRERDLLRAVAIAARDGAAVEEIEELAAAVIAEPAVVDLRRAGPLPDNERTAIGKSDRRYTTVDLLNTERQLVEAAASRVREGSGIAAQREMKAAIASRPHLSDEQLQMVRELTEGGAGVAVVHALAGSGKTTALGAAVEAWSNSGYHVIGACLSARAASVLRAETGVEASTMTQLLTELRYERFRGFAPNTVLLVDEAGQVGTRALAEVHRHLSRSGAKLVLVGDTRQLPEIEAGGAFRGLAERLGASELTVNYRQVDDADKHRVAALRSGDAHRALRMYEDAGLFSRGANIDEVHSRLVGDWYSEWRRQESDRARANVVMLALTNRDVEQLNLVARERLLAEGLISGPGLQIGDRVFQPGDHVVTRRNDRALGVLNGDRWIVAAADSAASELELRPDGRDGQPVTLSRSYLLGEDVQHGYALTVNVAQGSTVDAAFVLGSDSAYLEVGYTAATRARRATRFYVVDASEPHSCLEHAQRPLPDGNRADALEDFAERLSRSRAQTMALDLEAIT